MATQRYLIEERAPRLTLPHTSNGRRSTIYSPVSENGEEGSGVPDGLRREISAVSTTSSLSSSELEGMKYL